MFLDFEACYKELLVLRCENYGCFTTDINVQLLCCMLKSFEKLHVNWLGNEATVYNIHYLSLSVQTYRPRAT